MYTSRTPSPEDRSRPSVPCGKAIEPAFRARLRPCAEVVASGPIVEGVTRHVKFP